MGCLTGSIIKSTSIIICTDAAAAVNKITETICRKTHQKANYPKYAKLFKYYLTLKFENMNAATNG